MTSFIRCLPLSMFRTGMMTLTFGVLVSLGSSAFKGSSGKDESHSILPPMSRVFTSQSCTEEVPLIFSRLPVLAEYVKVSARVCAANAMTAAALNTRPNCMMFFICTEFKGCIRSRSIQRACHC